MSTYGQLYLYDVPAGQARPLLDTILDEGLVEDSPVPTSRTHLVLGGEGYRCREVEGGWLRDDLLVDALLAAAPGATWMAWEDPAEGGHGTVCVHVPDLGVFRADCDKLGTPTFPTHVVEAAAADPSTAHELTGTAWFTRVLELRDRLGPDGADRIAAPPAVRTTRAQATRWSTARRRSRCASGARSGSCESHRTSPGGTTPPHPRRRATPAAGPASTRPSRSSARCSSSRERGRQGLGLRHRLRPRWRPARGPGHLLRGGDPARATRNARGDTTAVDASSRPPFPAPALDTTSGEWPGTARTGATADLPP